MSIKSKGIIQIEGLAPDLAELNRCLSELEDGEYAFYLCDKKTNKVLPRLKYLFGVVLKTLSDELPEHPPIDALYKYFEKRFAPVKEVELFGEVFGYQDLKNCTSIEMDKVVTEIVHYAKTKYGVNIFSRQELKHADASVPYVGAYDDQWTDYSRTI